MAQGSVTITNRNLAQNEAAGVEKRLLFIGEAEKLKGTVTAVNTQSDFTDLFGTSDMLVSNLEAARLNGGQTWEARVLVLDKDQDDVLTADNILAIENMVEKIATAEVEGIVICSMHLDGELKALAEAMQAVCAKLIDTYAQPMFCLVPTTPFTETDWPTFIANVDTQISSVAAERILVVPETHDGYVNIGILAGRLCRHDVSIADKPMKVLTGAVAGLGDPLVLGGGEVEAGSEISLADLAAMDQKRLTVPQMYIGKPGWFWGDANTLADPNSDYKVLENVRITDYAGRRIRMRTINMIGDRSINSTPESMDYTQGQLIKILNRMSRSAVVNGKPEPGMIETPKPDAIVLHWADNNLLDIFYSLKPFDVPVTINNTITIDLSDPNE